MKTAPVEGERAEIGIIGGTGVYDPSMVEDTKELKLTTPYGAASYGMIIGVFRGRRVVFIPRHGAGHSIPPHKVNWRANIWALKELGCERVLATCATGSLKEEYKPGDVVFVDQFIDMSKKVHTFYDEGRFYHVSLAEPFCPEMNSVLSNTAEELNIPHHSKGTYLRIEGPQFSTRAASRMYRQFADLIGMTGVPEAILCREKEMCFAAIATITDYDCWRVSEKPVSFDEIKATIPKNMENTKRILERAISNIPKERSCSCKTALSGAEA